MLTWSMLLSQLGEKSLTAIKKAGDIINEVLQWYFVFLKTSSLRNDITMNIFCPCMAWIPLCCSEEVWAFLPCQAHEICHLSPLFIPLRLRCTLSARHKLQKWKMIQLQKLFLKNCQEQAELHVSPVTCSLPSGKRLQSIFYRGFSIYNAFRGLRAPEEKICVKLEVWSISSALRMLFNMSGVIKGRDLMEQ